MSGSGVPQTRTRPARPRALRQRNRFWNKLGAEPARRGAKGSVFDLVPLANRHGFYWGGHFAKRRDGMHFEFARPGV